MDLVLEKRKMIFILFFNFFFYFCLFLVCVFGTILTLLFFGSYKCRKLNNKEKSIFRLFVFDNDYKKEKLFLISRTRIVKFVTLCLFICLFGFGITVTSTTGKMTARELWNINYVVIYFSFCSTFERRNCIV